MRVVVYCTMRIEVYPGPKVAPHGVRVTGHRAVRLTGHTVVACCCTLHARRLSPAWPSVLTPSWFCEAPLPLPGTHEAGTPKARLPLTETRRTGTHRHTMSK
eukprot:gnl/Trimastix_PCT/2058.p4 GENE.gnl/Trimastix_PCT/2058~~gnl/Trimastix_PCT/2058.p4  ORF type:complete len:102 (+),score=3.77 gnl/Trimastix_PCT/2058:2436-2741(+)